MISKRKRQKREKSHEQKVKKRGRAHPEFYGNSVNHENVNPPEEEYSEEEHGDSKEETQDMIKETDEGIDLVFDIETYKPSMIRAALILETEKGVKVFETTWLSRGYKIRSIIEEFKKKAGDFKSAEKLIDHFLKNPVVENEGTSRSNLLKYYIEFKGRKYPLSLFTPSGSPRQKRSEKL